MLKNAVFLAVLLSFGGCATRPPASCDGSQRRPINQPSHASVLHLSCGAEVA